MCVYFRALGLPTRTRVSVRIGLLARSFQLATAIRLSFARSANSRSARSKFSDDARDTRYYGDVAYHSELGILAGTSIVADDNRGGWRAARRCNVDDGYGAVSSSASESAREDQRSGVCTKLAAERD